VVELRGGAGRNSVGALGVKSLARAGYAPGPAGVTGRGGTPNTAESSGPMSGGSWTS